MATNAKIKARKAKRDKKSDAKFVKLLGDIQKVMNTGDMPSHYVGGGQPFTRGKSKK